MPAAEQVRRRRVFYIPGYDPIHPRRYRELYRSEGSAQGKLSGYALTLKPKQGGGRYGWSVDAEIEGQKVSADFEVLVWSDLVRSSMQASILGTYGLMLATAWRYIASGALRRLMWLRKGPVIAALYPVGMLLVQAVAAVLIGILVAKAAAWSLGVLADRGLGAQIPALVTTLLQGAVFIASAWAVLRWCKRQDGRFFAYYLMHDYAYSARWQGANPPELEARLAEFRAAITAALNQNYDEVLVVGHSSGAHLAVSVLADLLHAEDLPSSGPVLSFLSLGQVVPMVSFLPKASRLRRDLAELSAQDQVFWLDVTAPGDGCSFALCDPVATSGVAPGGQMYPLILSAAFSQTLSTARWKELRWRFFRLHFQYLCAFDNLKGRADDYDYFRATAGPLTLRARFSGRSPSASRITRAASPYRSTAPRV